MRRYHSTRNTFSIPNWIALNDPYNGYDRSFDVTHSLWMNRVYFWPPMLDESFVHWVMGNEFKNRQVFFSCYSCQHFLQNIDCLDAKFVRSCISIFFWILQEIGQEIGTILAKKKPTSTQVWTDKALLTILRISARFLEKKNIFYPPP